jgi:hypothetical protein
LSPGPATKPNTKGLAHHVTVLMELGGVLISAPDLFGDGFGDGRDLGHRHVISTISGCGVINELDVINRFA